MELYKLWRLVQDCQNAPAASGASWGQIANHLLGCPATQRDTAMDMQTLYSQCLLPFDHFIHQRLAEGHGFLISAAGPSVGDASAKPSPGSSVSQVERVLRRGPKASTGTVMPTQAAAQQLLHSGHVNRGQKRPRSPSQDPPDYDAFLASAKGAQTAAPDPFTTNIHLAPSHGQPEQQAPPMQPKFAPGINHTHLTKPQQQQHAHHKAPSTASNHCHASQSAHDVPQQHITHHVHFAHEQHVSQSVPDPHQHQQPRISVASSQAHPAGLHPNQQQPPTSTDADTHSVQTVLQQTSTSLQHNGSDDSKAGHVEGMTAEELVAAATRAAAASGYCSPKGLADFVGTSLQVNRIPRVNCWCL